MAERPDNAARDAKKKELIGEVSALLAPEDARFAERLVDAYCELSPPINRDPPLVMGQITLNSGGMRGGETRKPGNLRFNWRKLHRELGDIVLNSAGALAVPVLIPFAALSLWNKFWSHATIPLSREQATALFAMWHRKDTNDRIAMAQAIEGINELLTVFKLPLLDASEFDVILRDLALLECIEVSDDGTIWLCEWVSAGYT